MAYDSANFALAAKVRAMFGHRLTSQNYKELLRKQTVNEVAAYLKQQPSYSDILKDVNENLIHRGQLENILRRQVYNEYIKLFHYINQSERSFYHFFTTEIEISAILSRLRYINAGCRGEYDFGLPSFMAKYFSLDIIGLLKVRSFGDLLDILKSTPYFDLLKGYEAGQDEKIDTTKLDIELRKWYYGNMIATVKKDFKGDMKKEVLDSVGMEIDLENLMVIMRLKKYFNSPAEYIRSLILPFYYKVSKEEVERIILEPDAASTWKSIFATFYGKNFKNYNFDYLEKYEQQVKYEFHRKLLVFSYTAPVIVRSYMELKRSELANLINIIEGIRYALPPSEISKLLVGTEE